VQDYQRLLLARRDPLERPYAARTALYDAVLRPARARIAAGAQVILVPDGALHGLNFETLVVEEGRPRYWVEDVIVSVAPSLRVLRWERREPRRPNLLFIGDPEPPAGEFPPLPHLKEELAIIRDAFPAPARRIYSRAEATPAAYREAGGGKFSAIHLAAHAVANPASPLNSAVVLSRRGESYKLYAQDVLEVPLEAELVTLSACRGAGARSYSGEGLMGFTWAFLQAGARHVVAGLWDVDDAATARLMGELYGGLAAGRHPDDALRAAKLALLRAGGPHRRPFFWGPFQLFTRVVD
jgi:CHAT domain-containing protein